MAEEPKIPRTKHHLWRLGAYLTPFVYAAVLLLWPHALPATLVICAGIFVVGLFLAAAVLHLRDVGAVKRLEGFIHSHVWYSVGIIASICCIAVGGMSYLLPRLRGLNKPPSFQDERASGGDHSPRSGAVTNSQPTSSAAATSAHPNSTAKPGSSPVRSQPASPNIDKPKVASQQSPASSPEPKPVPPVVIGGNVDQSGDGCQQKIIGGSNNTQNCVPPPRNVDSEKVVKAVMGAPGILFVLWEDGTPDGLRVARQLSTALQQQWRQGATVMKMGDPEAFPFGVTLSTSPESSEEVKAAVDSLKKALTAQGIECGSIPKEGATVNVVWVAVAGR